MRIRPDITVAFGSVKGHVRTENQDDYVVFEPEDDEDFVRHGRLLAIADGMGGGPGGSEASRVALRSFLSAYLDGKGDAETRFHDAFRVACDSVTAEADHNRSLAGMGTTLTAVTLHGSKLLGLHVGDSRCLLVTEGQGRWLSSVHLSALEEHRLTRAVVAGQPYEEPDFFAETLKAGDSVLLITDGVWRALSEEECLATVEACGPADAVEQLLVRAQQASGDDNATAVLLRAGVPGAVADDPIETAETEAEERMGVPSHGFRHRNLASYWPWVFLLVGFTLFAVAFVLYR